MRRRIIVVFLALFWMVLAQAFAADRGALFKVAGKGHTMYLFGTMHVGLPEFYPLEPRITQAVANAPTLALEVDTSLPPQAMAKVLRDYGMAAPGATMPPALKARLERALRHAGVEPAAMAPFKPWLVAMMLAIHEFEGMGYRGDLAADAHLAALARAGKARVIELESAQTQLALFNGLSEADQLRYLDDSLALIESGKHRVEMREIADAWASADQAGLDAIAARVENDATFSGRFMQKVLLDGRNGAMADKLMLLLEREDNAVAAIGVLHLLGKNSVPALMRARGVTVERVY
ncbi:MAG: TraB/GumN family protein [Massilia sp.]|nr:TraB/GumN family protein [Massilia sp.]